MSVASSSGTPLVQNSLLPVIVPATLSSTSTLNIENTKLNSVYMLSTNYNSGGATATIVLPQDVPIGSIITFIYYNKGTGTGTPQIAFDGFVKNISWGDSLRFLYAPTPLSNPTKRWVFSP